jgi:hypothetical protein
VGAFTNSGVRRVPWWRYAILLYVVLALLTALSWEASHDEGVTWDQAIARIDLPDQEHPRGFGELRQLLGGSETPSPVEVVARLTEPGGMHPPAYYWALNALVRIGGSGRVWLSLPMIALGVLTLFSFRRIAAAVVPVTGAGELALLLMAVSPWFVGYSVLARPYALVTCLAVLSTEALLRSLAGSRRAFALFLVLSTLGLYSLYHYVFVCVWHVLLLAVYSFTASPAERRGDLQRIAITAGVWAIGYLPWMPNLLHHTGVASAGNWYFTGVVAPHEWPARAWYVVQVFGLNGALGHEWVGVLVLGCSVLTVGFAVLFIRSLRRASPTRGDRASNAAFAAAGVVPLAILSADLTLGTHTLFLSKTSFVLFPIGLLCLTRAWAELSTATSRRTSAVLWLTIFLSANVLTLDSQLNRHSPMSSLAEGISRSDGANHIVLLSSPARGYVLPLLLALRDAGVKEVRVAVASAQVGIEGVVREFASKSDVSRVTLVDFSIPWEQSSWGEARLSLLAANAQRTSWQIGAVDAPILGADAERRVLTIASPVWVPFYSR